MRAAVASSIQEIVAVYAPSRCTVGGGVLGVAGGGGGGAGGGAPVGGGAAVGPGGSVGAVAAGGLVVGATVVVVDGTVLVARAEALVGGRVSSLNSVPPPHPAPRTAMPTVATASARRREAGIGRTLGA